jgi:subtilisin family serine protease
MKFNKDLFLNKKVMLCFLIILFPVVAFGQTLTSFVPNDPYFLYNKSNPDYYYFPGQWYLQNEAPSEITVYINSLDKNVTMKNSNVSANLKGAWDLGYTGKGVVIGIIDDGVNVGVRVGF